MKTCFPVAFPRLFFLIIIPRLEFYFTRILVWKSDFAPGVREVLPSLFIVVMIHDTKLFLNGAPGGGGDFVGDDDLDGHDEL